MFIQPPFADMEICHYPEYFELLQKQTTKLDKKQKLIKILREIAVELVKGNINSLNRAI